MKNLRTYTALLGCLLTLGAIRSLNAQSPPQVVSVFPANQTTQASRHTDIVIDFDREMDLQSLGTADFSVFGRWSGVMNGSIAWEANHFRLRFTPATLFSAGEWVTVMLSRNITDTSGTPLPAGYSWNFWIAAAPASMELAISERIPVRQPGEGHIQTYGAYGGDLNGDGFSDFTVPNEISNDVRVFLNDQQGGYSSFTIFPLPNADRPSTNEGADFNGDGFIDIAIGNTQNDRVQVLLGDGVGGFGDITSYSAAQSVRGLTVMDLNGDARMDIVTANRDGDNISLLMNNGDGTFAAAVNMEGGGSRETACAAADANGDGILDLFVGAYQSDELLLLLGDGNGGLSFSDRVSLPAGSRPWMVAVGDVNSDGTADVVSANSGNSTVSVASGDGAGGLQLAQNYDSGANFPLAIDLGDVDGDGDLDMMVSNFGTTAPGSGKWRLWENDGSGNFSVVQDFPATIAASCAVFHDRDNDGDTDITGIDEMEDELVLLNNDSIAVVITVDPVIERFKLFPNFPNPFNPRTRIQYQLPQQTEVELAIFDLQGRVINILDKGVRSGGRFSVVWNGTDQQGRGVASGIYLYRLQTPGFSKTRKLLLLR